jgi:hypothetical protein
LKPDLRARALVQPQSAQSLLSRSTLNAGTCLKGSLRKYKSFSKRYYSDTLAKMTKMSDRPQDIPVKKLISALLAISFGTIIEWVSCWT